MDPTKLLDQFLGADAKAALGQAGGFAKEKMGGMGGLAGGAAAGGLVALLFGSKKVRKLAGGVVGYGGAAALGALALKAYQNYQDGKSVTAKGADPDTLVASARAYVAALNKLMIKRLKSKPEPMNGEKVVRLKP